MAMTAAERRAELEAKLAKLDPDKAVETLASRKARIESQLAKLEGHKDIEGKIALFDVNGDGKFKVRVVINSFSRKVYGKDLFDVSPLDGEGSTSASMAKLEIENTDPEQITEETANPGNPGNGGEAEEEAMAGAGGGKRKSKR